MNEWKVLFHLPLVSTSCENRGKIEFHKTDDLDMTLTQPFLCLQLFLFIKCKVKTLFEYFLKCEVLALVPLDVIHPWKCQI